MARVKGGLFTTTLDVNKRFPLDSRMLVTKREDLINPMTWITNTLTTESTYDTMIVSVNSDGEHNGVYYLLDRKAITADNYSAYQAALEAGGDVSAYFSMWAKLGTVDDISAVEEKLKNLVGEIPDGKTISELIANIKPSGNLIPVDGTIVVASTDNGDKTIRVAISGKSGNAISEVDDGLFSPTYVAGNGIDIKDDRVSVKIANDAHGLTAVGEALSLNLASKSADGAMSKEDKCIIDAIPHTYIARKYDVLDTPQGTLVNYGDGEIRIMVPFDAEYVKQNVGAGGDANTYYLTLRTYAPRNAVGYKEYLGNQFDNEILADIKTDEYGRRYQPTWLGLAKYDDASGAWIYYGKNSAEGKYIGWDYRIDWYDTNDALIASDSVRINLSNEGCHNNIKPYYMANYATSTAVHELKECIEEIQQNGSWEEW